MSIGKSNEKSVILDAGCGAGIQSKFLATDIKNGNTFNCNK